MELTLRARIMDESALLRTIARLAHQIIEKNNGTDNLCLIGVRTRGYPIAKRLADNIRRINGDEVPVGALDITMYRDDLTSTRISDAPIVSATEVPFPVEGKTVILVDDVFFTGRTARAAMDAITDLGRPARIQLVCLIDRGHAEVPIKATYVGKHIPTTLREVVAVQLPESDSATGVFLYEKSE